MTSNLLNNRHVPPPKCYKHIVISYLHGRNAIHGVSILIFVFFILFSPSLLVSDYELKPFKLKELPPQKEKKIPLKQCVSSAH